MQDLYPASEPGKQPLIIQSTESMQLFHGRHQGLHRRSIHEVERQQVVDTHRWNVGGLEFSMRGMEKPFANIQLN